MDDSEDRYDSAIEAGQHNLRTIKLLNNWCFHAELVRSGGRGMIEAATNLPIGHMGVQCKFSKKNTMHCWLLEDAAYDFYQNNCKDCKERLPIDLPNIMSFVGEREEAANNRKMEREKEGKERKQKQIRRHQERANLRVELNLEETFVFDLLDELDSDDISIEDPRLEQLANLAPETFTRKVIEHLLPAAVHEHLPYSNHAAKALLRAQLEPEEKLLIALRLINNQDKSQAIIDIILAGAEKLSVDNLNSVLSNFTYLALGPPPEMHFGMANQIVLDTAPILALFQKRGFDICSTVNKLIIDLDPQKTASAIKIILAIGSNELILTHTRTIFSILMHRHIAPPGERWNNNILYYFREAASMCFERFPLETDNIIQSLLSDNKDTEREEAYRAYSSALKHRYRELPQIGIAQRIAFKRLLWAAVERPENSMDDATQFFRHSWDEYAQLAVEHFDDLIGGAVILGNKYDQIDRKNPLIVTESLIDHMERGNKRSSIDSLQSALIEWAAVGAKAKGLEGIEQFLELYRKLPKAQEQIRGNMIVHASKLLTGVESLKLLLSDWYGALMDESQIVRAKAAQAWGDVPYELANNFPDLFFESFSVLLTDPYRIVHQSAVHALRRRPFPKDNINLIKYNLWILINHYSTENKKNDFVVDCIDTFLDICITDDEMRGKIGLRLLNILLELEGSALYRAVDRLHNNYIDIPGFTKVALKSIQDGYTRSISIDDCAHVILRAPLNELQNCTDDIKMAFKALKPFRPDTFNEALMYAATLSKAEDYATASTCFKELTASIPAEDRYKLWRLNAALVAAASEIEYAIECGNSTVDLIKNWSSLLSELEKEHEERVKLRDLPPEFFFED